MSEIILVTGGARSGKSSFAEHLLSGIRSKTYLATAPVTDDEMRVRIERHKARRAEDSWCNVEEQFDLAGVIAGTKTDALLVDCLTLWISNLMYRNPDFSEPDSARESDFLVSALKSYRGKAVLVINEVGFGIVPENKLARTFRDCSGRCAQTIAAVADQVWLTVCGIPLKIKG